MSTVEASSDVSSFGGNFLGSLKDRATYLREQDRLKERTEEVQSLINPYFTLLTDPMAIGAGQKLLKYHLMRCVCSRAWC